jgi:fermentation-respiration switch protein FrsA (DUF1100 family)
MDAASEARRSPRPLPSATSPGPILPDAVGAIFVVVMPLVAAWSAAQVLGAVALAVLLPIAGFLAYVWLIYVPQVARMFAKAPVFQPMRGEPDPGGEDVRFSTADGLELAGTYYPTLAPTRLGVVAFCHEYLGDRHTAYEYVGYLRNHGFDLFAFDFRNHGDSQAEPNLAPIQWVTDRELTDLRAALDYLRGRPDADPAGVGLFGVSRGGSAALCVAAEDPTVWAVATDGAFPTSGTVLTYIYRWAEILVADWWVKVLPRAFFRWVSWTARRRASRRLNRQFPRLETAVTRIAPRPWLAIHGERDTYIGPEVAADLVRQAGRDAPVTLWLVPEAKHNRCREVAPDEYRRRVTAFFTGAAPRQARSEGAAESADEHETDGRTAPAAAARLGPRS